MANLRTNNLSGEQGQNAYRGSVFFDGSSFLSFNAAIWNSTASDSCTFECWLWVADLNSARNIFDLGNLGDFSIQTDGQVRVHPVNSNWMDTNNSVTTKSWHHIALVQESGRKDVYINGVKSSMTVGAGNPVSSDWSNTNANTFNLGDDGTYRDFFRGYMSNVRVLKGVALYDDDFTPPFTELKATDPNTSLLCCQNSDDVTQEETGKTITGNGSLATAGFNKTQPKVIPPYGVDAGNTFGGSIQQSTQGYMYFPTGRTEERGRGRALFAGGYAVPQAAAIKDIYYSQIESTGTITQFGELTVARWIPSSGASSTRGVFNGGGTPSRVDTIDFVTIATTSNATDFGDLNTQRTYHAGFSNSIRAISGGGNDGSSIINSIEFMTIANTGDASDFGDLTTTTQEVVGDCSPTRGLFMGGVTPSKVNTVEFITIASTGNASNFGDLNNAAAGGGALSSNTRALYAGGDTPSRINTIDFFTIATTGDATDFGDLINAVGSLYGATSNNVRGVFVGGFINPGTNTNNIEHVTIATTGDAIDFGDLVYRTRGTTATSDSHGGLS